MTEISAVRSLLAATLPLMKAPPVNLGAICTYLNIEVYGQPCHSFGAMYVKNGEQGIVLVNTSMPITRARFSIAHELGHIILGHTPIPHITAPHSVRQEREADRFASELLMPSELILNAAQQLSFSDMKKRYRVSKQALEIRLKQLMR